jgi:hypothetical protein
MGDEKIEIQIKNLEKSIDELKRLVVYLVIGYVGTLLSLVFFLLKVIELNN